MEAREQGQQTLSLAQGSGDQGWGSRCLELAGQTENHPWVDTNETEILCPIVS